MRGGGEWNGDVHSPDLTKYKFDLKGDGDFRSEECTEYLKEADIVVTNPPFSLFREYLSQLVEYDKKFIILGNMNSMSTVKVFPLFQENRVWFGVENTGRKFGVPDRYDDGTRTNIKIDKDGNIQAQFGNVWWYTNLPHGKRKEEIPLYKKYNKKDYPKYDNYDAIHVGGSGNIPKDYPGVMGVSTAFMDKFNPDQFEIMGITGRDRKHPLKTKIYTAKDMPRYSDFNRGAAIYLPGGRLKNLFTCLFIRNRNPR